MKIIVSTSTSFSSISGQKSAGYFKKGLATGISRNGKSTTTSFFFPVWIKNKHFRIKNFSFVKIFSFGETNNKNQ